MAQKGESTVLWWIGWIVLTLASFFVSCFFWTVFIARNDGTVHEPGVAVLWVTAVFGSWMVLLVPLIIVMYTKVDKAYEDARIARETANVNRAKKDFGVKALQIDDSKRLLRPDLTRKLKKIPFTIRRGHLVTAYLRDGRRIENIFIMDRKDVLGIYGTDRLTFDIADITDIEPVPMDKIPDFRTEGWLRLDGVGA